MKLNQIQVGKTYQTTHGIGIVLDKSPQRVSVKIQAPLPLGLRYLTPREVSYECEPLPQR